MDRISERYPLLIGSEWKCVLFETDGDFSLNVFLRQAGDTELHTKLTVTPEHGSGVKLPEGEWKGVVRVKGVEDAVLDGFEFSVNSEGVTFDPPKPGS